MSSNVDDFTITVPLASAEMRLALAGVAQAFADAEAACGPSGSGGGGGIQHAKPESKPPAGNIAAVHLCRRITRDANRIRAAVITFYVTLDPAERKAAREFREVVKGIRKREAKDVQERLASLYAGDTGGRPVVRLREEGERSAVHS